MPETRYVLIHILVQLRIRASILYSRSRSENRVSGIFQSVRKMTVTIIKKKKEIRELGTVALNNRLNLPPLSSSDRSNSSPFHPFFEILL